MTVSRGLDRGTVELCYVLVGYAGLGSSRRARYEPLHKPFRYFFSYPVPTQNGSGQAVHALLPLASASPTVLLLR